MTDTCGSRFLAARAKNPDEDARLACNKKTGHRGQHWNASGDLRWSGPPRELPWLTLDDRKAAPNA